MVKPLRPRNRNDKLIVSVGTNPELLWLREAVLQSAGFEVLTIPDEKEALAKIEAIDCGVLLLCYSVDEHAVRQITKKYRESCPDGRIVAITNATLANSAVEADALVYGLEGPDALLAAISGSHDPLGNRKPIQQRRLQSKKPGAYSKGS
jgi:PleD family two-component response regulator